MKKFVLILLITIFSGMLYGNSLVWNKDNNFKDWTFAYLAKKEISDGILVLTNIKFDCQIAAFNLNIDPEKYNTFTYTYRVTGGQKTKGEFYFAHLNEKFSDSRRWNTPALNNDGQWHTVSVSPHSLKSWVEGGMIKSLRFDPTNSAGGKIEIREMRLEWRDLSKKKAIIDGPVWPAVKSELWTKNENNNNDSKYFVGKMIRAIEDIPDNRKYSEFYLRKNFVLKEKPLHAFIQYTADDCAEIFVNGQNAGNANNWRTCVTADVAKFLKKGKNTIAFYYINEDRYGGILAELYVQYKDGSSERINSDKKFRSSVVFSKTWNQTDFDDSQWHNVIEQTPPPAAPWKQKIPYRYFENIIQVISAETFPQKVKAGDQVQIKLLCKGKIPPVNSNVSIVLKKDKKNLFTENISLKKENIIKHDKNSFVIQIAYQTPKYIKAGKFDINIDLDTLSTQSSRYPKLSFITTPVKCDPEFPKKNICRIVKKDDIPYIELNGKPFFMSWINANDKFVPAELPVNVVTVGTEASSYWPRTGTFCPEAFDIAAEKKAKLFPNAYFIFNISLVVPNDWRNLFRDEMALLENGNIASYGYPPHSYSSPTAQKHFKEIIAKSIRYLENSPYANRIIGYRISGGYTGEWLGWEPGNSALDFSMCSKNAYSLFFKKNYPQFKNSAIPLKEERINKDNDILWNKEKYHRAVAYQQFTSRQVIDFLIPLCRKLREEVGSDKIIGTYYGYTATLHHTGYSQYRAYYDLKYFLDAGVVDFLMSPNSYPLRNLGDTCGEMKPFRTLQNNNIIPVCEDDTRTHNSYDVSRMPGSSSQTVTEFQSIAVERRNMGIAICRNSPNYFYPLVGGGEVSFPAMKKEIAILHTVGQHCLDNGAKRNSQTALIVSEESIKSIPSMHGLYAESNIIDQYYNFDGSVKQIPRVKNLLNYETFVGNQGRFLRSGAPVDILLAEDLKKSDKNYKLYVFLNIYEFNDEILDTIKKLQQKKCTILYLYAPGYYKGFSSGIANMTKLTGFYFEKLPIAEKAEITLKNGKKMGTPTVEISPLFAIKDPQAESLGKYPCGKIGAAVKKTNNALSIFSGVWQLSTDFIDSVMNKAGIFRYAAGNDPLEANDSLIVIHARNSGTKKIMLPYKAAAVLDVYNNKIIARNADNFECKLKLHETKLFYYGKNAAALQQKLQEINSQ